VDTAGGANDIVVFATRREGRCAECGEEFSGGGLIRMENDRPLCLACADLAHLEFLPPGNAALTRRAGKYSPLRAVVVRWARARNRYERQGILVTRAAIERAERECLADAEIRERRRVRAAGIRAAAEPAHVQFVASAIGLQFPGCPPDEARRVAEWTCRKNSGRVGRSAAAKELDPDALRLAVVAHIRHEHTPYDEILAATGDRALARAKIADQIQAALARWRTPPA
jgi:hypothetical protein